MNTNNVIKQFVYFINNSYDEVAKLFNSIENDGKNIILADKIENGFYQFMWEIIVESQLCVEGDYIEPYGDGADFNEKSSRVVSPEKMANCKISVNIKNKLDYFSQKNITIENLDLVKFVNYNGREYFVEKPFDFVLCDDSSGKYFLFRLNDAEFLFAKTEEDK